MKNETFDCIVIGGGPAGCTAASLVAQQGWRTALIERERLPQYKIGESLMPETWWTFEKLGILEELDTIGFTRKHGVQFVSSSDKESKPFIFTEFDDRPCAMTFHVQRAEFDVLLYETARKNGATCIDETRVMDVEFKDNGQHSVIVQDIKGKERTLKTRVVVDASGQQTVLANRMKTRVIDEDFKKAAIWSYFEGGICAGGSNPEVTCILHTHSKEAWFWYIPLSDGKISVGVVGDNDFLLKRGGKPENTFKKELANCPGLQRRLRDAKCVDRYRVAKEFSYSTTQRSGDGWVLVGDAYGFIDPIYSSGVFLALKSAEMASAAICDGLRRGDLSAENLGNWTYEFDAGVHWIRRLILAFYNPEFSFGDFMKNHPQHQMNLTNLLIGRVFEGDPGKIFEDLDPWIENLGNRKKSKATAG